MSSSKINSEQFLAKFSDFLEDYRLSDLEDTKEQKRLERQFSNLKNLSFSLSEKDVTLPGKDGIVLQNFFRFGAQKYQDFCRVAIAPLLSDPSNAAENMARYIKTQEAYELIKSQGKKRSAEDNARLTELLGGILGVDLGEKFVEKVDMETFGRFVCYSNTGLCKKDVETYNSSRSLKKSFPTVQDYLIAQVFAQDVELLVSVKDPENGVRLVGAIINQENTAQKLLEEGRTNRSQFRMDSCFLDMAAKKAVIGASTANVSPEKQLVTLVNSFLAFNSRLGASTVAGVANDLQGFELEVVYVVPAQLPSEQKFAGRHGGQAGEDFFKKAGELEFADRNTIAKAPFLALLAESGAKPETNLMLRHLNVFILGADTEDLHYKMRNAASLDSAQVGNREMAKVVLSEILELSSLLARDDMQMAFDWGSKGASQNLVTIVSGAMQNYFTNFPLADKQELDREERQMLLNVSKSLALIHEKLTDGPDSGSDLIAQPVSILRSLSRNLNDKNVDDMALEESSASRRRQSVYQYDDQVQLELVNRENGNRLSDIHAAKLTTHLLSSLAQKQIPAALDEYLKNAMRLMALEGVESETVVAGINDCYQMIGGGHGRSVPRVLSQKEDRGEISGARNNFVTSLKRYEQEFGAQSPIAISINSIKHLFNENMWKGRAQMASATTGVAFENISQLARCMVDVAQLEPNGVLAEEIKSVLRSSDASPAKKKSRR